MTADGNQFILFEIQERKEGKKAGEKVQINHRFYPKISMLLDRLLHKALFQDLAELEKKNWEKFEEKYTELIERIDSIINRFDNAVSEGRALELRKDMESEEIVDTEKYEPKKKLKKIKKVK
jgi:hypothetical protein